MRPERGGSSSAHFSVKSRNVSIGRHVATHSSHPRSGRSQQRRQLRAPPSIPRLPSASSSTCRVTYAAYLIRRAGTSSHFTSHHDRSEQTQGNTRDNPATLRELRLAINYRHPTGQHRPFVPTDARRRSTTASRRRCGPPARPNDARTRPPRPPRDPRCTPRTNGVLWLTKRN